MGSSRGGPIALRAALSLDLDEAPVGEVSNLPLGSGICICFESKAHLSTSPHPFQGRAPRPVSGQLSAGHPGGVPGVQPAVSCCLSAAGVRFLGTLSCQTEFRPHCCRPTATAAHTRASATDPGRVYTFRTYETRTGSGALYTPGTAVFVRHRLLRGRRLPPLIGRSLSPRYSIPTRDVYFSRHQQEFPGSRPCGSFPSPVAAMVGTAALGLSRELRTRPIRNRPRTSRWDRSNTDL